MKKSLLALSVVSALAGLSAASFAAELGKVTLDGEEITVSTSDAAFGEDGKTVSADTAVLTPGESLAVSGLTISVGSKDAPGKTVSVSNSSNAGNGTSLTLGNDKTESVTVTGGAVDWAFVNYGKTDITAKTVTGDFSASQYGFHVGNATESAEAPANAASLTITADTIRIDAQSRALLAFSNGQMTLLGNADIQSGDVALEARGNASVSINAGDAGAAFATRITGDIEFGTTNVDGGDSHGSGKAVDAYVTIALNGADSVWNGRSYMSYTVLEDGEEKTYTTADVAHPNPDHTDYFGTVGHFALSVNDGASWNTTGDAFANTLTLNGGSIALAADSALYTGAFEVSGKGNTLSADSAQVKGTITLLNGAELSAGLLTAYTDIAKDGDVVTGASAKLDLTGDGTLRITDAFTYSAAGLTAMTDAYSGIGVIFDKATLSIAADEAGSPVIIPAKATVNLLAKGEGTDIASGGELSILGTLAVTDDAEGGVSAAKLGAATVKDGGTLHIQTALNAGEIHAEAGSSILVGTDEKSGKFYAESLKLAGTLFLDPVWKDGVANASEAAFNLSGDLDGSLIAGRNSVAEIGSADTANLKAALAAIGRTVAENDLKAAVYVNKAVTLGSGGLMQADGTLEAVPETLTSGVLIAEGSALIVNAGAAESGAAVTGSGGSFDVQGALYIDKAEAGKSITVADGFDSVTVAQNPLAVNRLITLTKADSGDGALILDAAVNTKLTGSSLASNTLVASASGALGVGADRISALFSAGSGLSDGEALSAYNSMALMGTASAAQALAVNTANMIADSVESHGLLLAAYAHEKEGFDLWADVTGSFSRASHYQAGNASYGYKSDIAGAAIGGDYTLGNGAAVGSVFNFGTGSARGRGAGTGIKNDLSYYALNLYEAWNTPYVNLISNIGYSVAKNEIKHGGYKGKPDVKTFSVGVRAEKDFKAAGSVTLTPHIGIRYMNVDMESFTAGGFKYSANKLNLAQIPVGVSVSGDFDFANGAKVKPFADVTVSPALGNKKAKNTFGLEGAAVSDTFSARVANDALYQGKVGLNAAKGNHSLAVSYGLGAGSGSRFDQTLQAKYRFSF
jgi:hypothetical protein